MTFEEARREAARRLAGRVEDPASDARHLLAFAAGVERGRLTLRARDPLPEGAQDRLLAAVAARLAGASVAHVVGEKAFWGRAFEVDAHTLAPRPETEEIVALALAGPFAQLVDLGTGTGCLGVTLLAERPAAEGLLTDASAGALAVAARNAARHGVEGRARLVRADWWQGIEGRFDLVVSNPPYLAEAEMAGLSPEVRAEPRLALTPGGDGLDAYRRIVAGLPARLSGDGRVLLEIGPTQGGAVAGLLRAAGLGTVRVHPDMDGRDRVVEGRAAG